MFLANREIFLKMLYSNMEIVIGSYCLEDHIYEWFDWKHQSFYFLMSPKTYKDFVSFKENLELLLLELI